MTQFDVWRTAITEWDRATMIDLREFYGIDVLDGETENRPWWWLRNFIEGLLDRENSRLSALISKGP